MALLEKDDPVAVEVQGAEVVTDEDDGAAMALVVGEDVEALLLESSVTDRKDLVHQQDVGVCLDGDGERQAHRHARREVLDLLVGELRELREIEDAVDAVGKFPAGQTQDGAAEEDVLAR